MAHLERVYTYIVDFKQRHDGIAPTLDEIKLACGLSSKSHALYYVRQLIEDGRITSGEKSPRTIKVAGGEWLPPK